MVEKVRQYLPALTLGSWLHFAGPFTLMLALILGIGPEVQRSVFSVIASDAPDIYSAAYETGIIRFPPPTEWLTNSLYWPYVLVAAGVALLALRASSLKELMFHVGVWSAVLLTVLDIAMGLVRRYLDVSYLLANVMSNIAGGVVAALLVGVALVLFRLTTSPLSAQPNLRAFVGAVVLIAFGGSVSVASYVGLRLLYHPLPATIILSLTPPLHGFFYHQATDAVEASDKSKTTRRKFDFLPFGYVGGGASMTNLKGKLDVRWKRAQAARPFDIEVHLAGGGCLNTDISALELGIPLVKKQDARLLTVEFDSGLTTSKIDPGSGRSFKFTGPAIFWLDSQDDGKSLKVGYFSTNEKGKEAGTLEVSSSDTMRLMINASLIGKEEKRLAIVPRSLSIEVDDFRWRGTIETIVPLGGDRRSDCRSLAPPSGDSDDPNHKVLIEDNGIGVVISIVASNKLRTQLEPEGSLVISGTDGWTAVTGVPAKDFKGAGGELTALMIERGVSGLEVDGRRTDINPEDVLLMRGELHGHYSDAGRVIVTGKANYLWKNYARVNATRWEKLGIEWQLAILGFVLSALGVAARWLWFGIKALADEDIKSWV